MFMQNPIERISLQTGIQRAHSTFGRCLYVKKTFPYEPGSTIELENRFGYANTTCNIIITTEITIKRRKRIFVIVIGDEFLRIIILVNLVLVIIGLLFSALYKTALKLAIGDYGQNSSVVVGLLLLHESQTLFISRRISVTVRNLIGNLVLCELSTSAAYNNNINKDSLVGAENFELFCHTARYFDESENDDYEDLCFVPILVAVVTVRTLYAGTLVTFWTTAPSHQKRRNCSSVLLAAFCLLLATLTIAARCYAFKSATHPLAQLSSQQPQVLSSIITTTNINNSNKHNNNNTKENKFQTHSSKIVLSRYFSLPYNNNNNNNNNKNSNSNNNNKNNNKDTQSDTRVILRNSKNLLSTRKFNINNLKKFLNAEVRKRREIHQEKVYKDYRYQRYDGKSVTDQNSALYEQQVQQPRISEVSNQQLSFTVNNNNKNNKNDQNDDIAVVSSYSSFSSTSSSTSASVITHITSSSSNTRSINRATYYNNYYYNNYNNNKLHNIPVRNLEAETNSVKFLTDVNLLKNRSNEVTKSANASVGAWNSSVNAPQQVSDQSLKPSSSGEDDRIGGRTGIERPMPPALDHSNNSLSSESAVLVLVVSAVVLTVALGLVTCVLSHYRGGTAADPHDAGQTPTTAPMLSVVSAGAAAGVGGMDRLRGRGAARELAATRDRQGRLHHPVHTDIAINLPPNIALPDGEDHPFSSSRLQIRDPEQESEIYQKCIKPPPNRTVLESESPPPYRSSSAGLLGSIGSSSSSGSSDWSGGSAPLVMRCHSMSSSSSTSKRPEAGPSGQKTDFIQRTVKIFTGKKSQPPPAPTLLPAVVVPTRPRQTTSEQQQQQQQQQQQHQNSGRPKPSV